MSTQDILFIVGLVLLGIGLVALAIAAWIFFSRNIPDLLADLSGKKRADALESMAQENRRTRRRSKSSETGGLATGAINVESSGSLGVAAQGKDADGAPKTSVQGEASDNAAVTTVMTDDSAVTTVLDPDAADATTLLIVDKNTDLQLEVEADQTNVMPAIKQKPVVQESIPDSFNIVRKIVLTQSVEFIQPEQGDGYA